MKFKNIILCGLLALLPLTACNTGTNSNGNDPEGNTTEHEEFVDTISFPKVEPYTSMWGNPEVEKAIEESIRYDIPYYEAPEYVTEITYDSVDDPVLVLYFQGFEEDQVDANRDKYVKICQANGYSLQMEKLPNGEDGYTDVYIMQYTINREEYIQVQILSGRTSPNAPYCFAAFCTRYFTVYPKIFPNNIVRHYLGYEIPYLEDENIAYFCRAEYDIGSGMKDVYIEMVGAYKEDEDIYYDLLIDNGYTIDDSKYEEYGYFATSYKGTHMIQFKYSEQFGPIDKQAICIFTWRLQ